jgi:hypothetical protein
MPDPVRAGSGIFVSSLRISMKPLSMFLGAAVIALASATGGYLLGKKQAHPSATAATDKLPSLAQDAKPGSKTPTRSRTDFSTLRSELDAQKDPLARFKLAIQNLEGWIDADPKAAMAWLQSQPRTARLQDVMRKALSRYATNDPKGAAEWAAANLTGHELNNSLILIAEDWAERNGLEAATWISAVPASRERDAAMESMFFAWAANDPAAAIDFIGKNASTPQLAAMLRYAAYAGWAKTDPVGAVNASLASSKTQNDPAQFANTLANWAVMDLAASSQWLLENVKSGDQRAASIQELAAIFAGQSPESGLEWIAKLNPGEERDSALNRLAAEWGSSDPAGAAKWAGSQTNANLDPEAVSHILHNFLAADSKAFETWRASLPEGPLKQQATQLEAPTAGEEPLTPE